MTLTTADNFAIARLAAAEAGDTFTIHYATNSFCESPAEANPVYCIVAKHVGTGKVFTFDAAQAGEASALDKFHSFAAARPASIYVHWNMRDERYGFAAIARRAVALGVPAATIADEQMVDLSAALWAIHGRDYINHPRLPNLIAMNRITSSGMLDLAGEEAARQSGGDFAKILTSTARKVEALADILSLTLAGTLATNPPAPADGPTEPDRLTWQAKTVHVAPKPLKLIAWLWTHRTSTEADAIRYVWDGGVSTAALKTCVQKANHALTDAGVPFNIARKAGHIFLS